MEESGDISRGRVDGARDGVIAAELEAVYVMVAEQIEARGPRCDASGRCCHFEQYGHRLYVTGLEAAYTLGRLGEVGVDGIGAGDVAAARARGDCPFLVNERCAVHGVRPLGCRVYFCERGTEEWQQELTERALKLIRGIHERHGLEYRYGEWRGMLEVLVG